MKDNNTLTEIVNTVSIENDFVISIALTGHTNTGKTTLLRCLIKQRIGTVEDRANVTTTTKSVTHTGLQANIIDTPGLVLVGEVSILKSIYKDEHTFETKIKEYAENRGKKNILLSLKVINELKRVDVVYHVVSTEAAPDENHITEIDLIKSYCSNVIGIINNSDNVHREQWEETFEKAGLSSIYYNFHWDNPQKQRDLYKKTYNLLDNDKKQLFKEGLRRLREDDRYRRTRISDKISETLRNINSVRATVIKGDNNDNNNQSPDQIKSTLTNQIKNIIDSYTRDICSIYCVPSIGENISPTPQIDSIENILVSEMDKRVMNAVEGATKGAIIGSAMTAAATLAVSGLSLGLFGIGAAIGMLAISGIRAAQQQTPTTRVDYQLSDEELFGIAQFLIAEVWTIAYFGFEKCHITKNKKERITYLIKDEIPELMKRHDITKDNYMDKISVILDDLGV